MPDPEAPRVVKNIKAQVTAVKAARGQNESQEVYSRRISTIREYLGPAADVSGVDKMIAVVEAAFILASDSDFETGAALLSNATAKDNLYNALVPFGFVIPT